jgi:hypothetical protein
VRPSFNGGHQRGFTRLIALCGEDIDQRSPDVSIDVELGERRPQPLAVWSVAALQEKAQAHEVANEPRRDHA